MPILYELKDHVARVTIDRDVLNAIDAASERELQKIWNEIEGNRDVPLRRADRHRRARVLDRRRHEGRQRRERARLLGTLAAGRLRRHRAARDARRAGDRAVNGHAVGGGFEMVLGCDIIVAARPARPSACPRRVSAACRSTAA